MAKPITAKYNPSKLVNRCFSFPKKKEYHRDIDLHQLTNAELYYLCKATKILLDNRFKAATDPTQKQEVSKYLEKLNVSR